MKVRCKREVGKEMFARGRWDAPECPQEHAMCTELLCRSGEVRGGRGRLINVCGSPRPTADGPIIVCGAPRPTA